MAQLEFFFDCSSPWTYLAFSQIETLAARHRAELVWRPILVGGVFNAVNRDVYETRANPNERKTAYSAKDLQDWARAYGLVIRWPTVFPVNAVKAMRGAIVAQRAGVIAAYARGLFEAYWAQDQDISQPGILGTLAEGVGLDGAAFLDDIGSDEVKAELRANTEDLVARGGFGSPTLFVNRTDMYFGNDRLVLVDRALAQLVD